MSKVYGFCDMNCKYEVATKEEFDALKEEIAYSPVEANENGIFILDQLGVEYVIYRKNNLLTSWGIKMVIHNSLLGDIDINPDNTYSNTMNDITYTLKQVPLDGEYIRYKVTGIEYKTITGGSSGGGVRHIIYNIQYKTENTSWKNGQVAMSISTAIGTDAIKYGGIKITQGVSEVKVPPIVERNFAVLESQMLNSMNKLQVETAVFMDEVNSRLSLVTGQSVPLIYHDDSGNRQVNVVDISSHIPTRKTYKDILKITGVFTVDVGVVKIASYDTDYITVVNVPVDMNFSSIDEDGTITFKGTAMVDVSEFLNYTHVISGHGLLFLPLTAKLKDNKLTFEDNIVFVKDTDTQMNGLQIERMVIYFNPAVELDKEVNNESYPTYTGAYKVNA